MKNNEFDTEEKTVQKIISYQNENPKILISASITKKALEFEFGEKSSLYYEYPEKQVYHPLQRKHVGSHAELHPSF